MECNASACRHELYLDLEMEEIY
ncbi:uncharacterized protein CPUR_02285 [Claviceps purpurea 20.1]|uniref:Uncharacterized protein n=1 Tax=Claviceps purpurea (strain 20.1) TaxID=1111077 RepID=M1W7Q4_CLAP2|nr:uncharacterized protein CPUR_02285 [Claviceps purpurea 20.1]